MVILEREAADVILKHCLQSHPEEACGVLVGPCEAGKLPARITRAFESQNLATDRRRGYLVDPALQLRLQRDLRGSGTEVVGVYHSHPDGPPRPSARDCDEAWPWFLYLIVEAFGDSTGQAAAFRWTNGSFIPVLLQVGDVRAD
ncbi:MAG: M67 family metallopeptidase [Planctomycetes bacterium]|nr:M67 family metallopeptidase [Planctomycetota bacterium]MBI3846207.1 M67 family metallopeptidase [Planctomycetota bacterium]